MQFFYVLRGCFAAFLFVYTVLICNVLLFQRDALIKLDFEFAVLVFVLGGGVAGFFSFGVILLWLLLAACRVSVSWWLAFFVAGFGASLMVLNEGLLAILIVFVFGGIVGCVFWVAAFGLQREQLLQVP